MAFLEKGSNLSAPPLLSLIVATRGRPAPFDALFASLEAQTERRFEVIIVDQNDAPLAVAAGDWSFPITHVHTPGKTGVSRARNAGLSRADGSIILFPDDDCWYPPHLLAHASTMLVTHGADVLSGRACDETGRDINGRFEKAVTLIDRANVWTTGIEWVVFFKREVLHRIGGYDVEIGVGASTPWQSCEAQDILLRALDQGLVCVFDPGIYGHHAELDNADPSMRRKGRAYARGLGYVLRHHGYPARTAAMWMFRPAAGALVSFVRGDMKLFHYYRNVALGRFEGWRRRIIGQRRSPPAGAAGARRQVLKRSRPVSRSGLTPP